MESNEEVLNLKFKVCDNIEYKVDENRIVTILEKQDHKIQRFFRKLKFKIPLYKEIDFDEISSEVFLQIDGDKTVKEIGDNLEKKYGEKVNPLYERLLIFLNHIYINCEYIEKID
ncbi:MULTISPECIES: PqqD family peptide modification chaperone [unclassified Clostridium]|uniref:PqqD family peptide modification chaperone n=1 Tax=Clostridium TaxID=1485 RepID=UPI001C8C217E|nr:MULTISPECIES: PqqD family peptide modification chaperone [unclassified Clostridium]MBX9137595.1 PqqD family peptide modification chaperone [Clostridium sp. K12(2020)]MBX9144405.1 PqqD family peptide modification chaperone [Clostridium sp. K13]MDU2289242.1 PqqD family peptide modification chaperone [Clostridium celatum]MDU4324300.1 PqqD family peptide modification chaperone [Clostridium celatum]